MNDSERKQCIIGELSKEQVLARAAIALERFAPDPVQTVRAHYWRGCFYLLWEEMQVSKTILLQAVVDVEEGRAAAPDLLDLVSMVYQRMEAILKGENRAKAKGKVDPA